jgi:hypothetical protein
MAPSAALLLRSQNRTDNHSPPKQKAFPVSWITPFFLAAFGAVIQEVGHWYELRKNLALKRYQQLIHSSAYWVITFAMTVCSGAGTAIWWYGETHTPKDYLVMGVAFPIIFKKAVSVFARKPLQLGVEPKPDSSQTFGQAVKSYFNVGTNPL